MPCHSHRSHISQLGRWLFHSFSGFVCNLRSWISTKFEADHIKLAARWRNKKPIYVYRISFYKKMEACYTFFHLIVLHSCFFCCCFRFVVVSPFFSFFYQFIYFSSIFLVFLLVRGKKLEIKIIKKKKEKNLLELVDFGHFLGFWYLLIVNQQWPNNRWDAGIAIASVFQPFSVQNTCLLFLNLNNLEKKIKKMVNKFYSLSINNCKPWSAAGSVDGYEPVLYEQKKMVALLHNHHQLWIA